MPREPERGYRAPEEPPAEISLAIRHHGNALFRRALWLTRDPSQAADLCQETWEHALRSAHQHSETVVTFRWLLTIMHNAFLDERRAEAVRRAIPDSGAVLEQMEGPTEEVPLWRCVNDEMLQTSLERLPPAGRQLIELQRSGLSYDEMAARTGVHVTTVGTRLLRARRRLRVLLAAQVFANQEP